MLGDVDPLLTKESYRAGEKLNLNAHFPHITGQSVFLESGQFSVHLCTMHKIGENSFFLNNLSTKLKLFQISLWDNLIHRDWIGFVRAFSWTLESLICLEWFNFL